MSELTDLRDHCRKQQAKCERTARALRRSLATTSTPAEIDTHLNPADDAPLWEMP